MPSYLDNRPGPSAEAMAEIRERRATKEINPEEAEARAARQARAAEVLAEAALVQAGDPEAVARAKALAEEHERQWEESQTRAEVDYPEPEYY